MKAQFLFAAVVVAACMLLDEARAQQAWQAPSPISGGSTASAGQDRQWLNEEAVVPTGYESAIGDVPAEGFASVSSGDCRSCEVCSDGACGDCGSCACCPVAAGCGRKWHLFGDFLYLRPRDAEVAYGVPIDGPVTQPDDAKFQIGPTAVADFDYEPSFRVGFAGALDDTMGIAATYTYFDAETGGSTSTLPPYLIYSRVSHPDTDVTSQQFLSATADYGLRFDLVDLDVRRVISCGCSHQITGSLGARYANLEQDFQAIFSEPSDEETVTTGVRFDGGGIRLGLDAEWYSRNGRWLVYGRSAASFVAGEFKASFQQEDLYRQSVIYTDWEAGRIVTMLDLEIGVGMTSCCGRVRTTLGYMVSGWFNTVNTDEWINAVQENEFAGLNGGMSFDGLVTRAEIRF
jgi:hypothetical protein